ncbi:MAG: MlaD family protein [Verrucomicrobiota bacterium]|jgi:phospholipid/cholesterol/gamma-HCH transport system substrate-binding protein
MKDSVESRLGMFFALAIIAALVIMESLGTFAFFKRGYHLHARFKNVQELKVGDSVKMGGVQVGRVEDIQLVHSLAEVTVNLDRKTEVKTDSKAAIKFTGLMGQNYFDIGFGTSAGIRAEDGATLESVEQPDLSELMVKIDSVATGVQNLTKSFSGEQIDKLLGPLTDFVKNNQTNLTDGISNIKTISGRIAEGQGTLGLLVNTNDLYMTALVVVSNLQSTSADIRNLSVRAGVLLDNANRTVTNANNVISQVNSGQGTLGRLVKDDALYRATTSSMTNLNQILQKINQGDGTVGKLINDDSTLNDVKLSLQKLDKATDSLEDTGPLSVLGTMLSSFF